MAGATPLGNMVIKLGLDDADFGKGVANSKKQVTYLAKEMQANMRIADMAGNKLGKLGTRYDSLSQIISAQKNQVSSLKKAYDESFVDGEATDSTKRLAAQLQEANGKLANYQMQLQNTTGQMARLQVETQGVTGWMKQHGDSYVESGKKIAAFGDGVSKVGQTLTVGVTAPIMAGALAVTKAAISWESAFAGVRKTNDEVVDSNGKVIYSYSDLENGLRGLAKTLPASHTEIAAVAEAAGQLGIKTQDVVSFTKVMLDMGESTNLSAEDAATAIAKIANITGLTSDEYQRFGSSVVALGNNFATTESDIVVMSNRLASAGTLAGLTNQEILGLATAMSSVGIEAEAGGTAMTQTLTAIETAATKGGESLDKFASIAGMSSEQFATTWKNKPIEAIQAFIKGLGDLDSQGESATLVLDEMGLSGVRQSNMLKSLALASDTMTSAVDMSNKAWSENTALTNEASTRYETTESKLKMLRNEIVDAAIDLGGPFVDALRNSLKAVTPFVENLGNLAKKFNELDSEQQQNILKWMGIAAAAGPVLKILGGGISIIGNTRSAIGELSGGIVELIAKSAEKSALTGLATGITGVGTASATAAGTSGVGAMIGSLGALVGPAGLVLATAGVVALGYAAWKGFGEEAANSAERVSKWGIDVGVTADDTMTKVKDIGGQAGTAFSLVEQGLSEATPKMVDNLTQIGTTLEEYILNKQNAFKTMISEMPQDIQNALTEIMSQQTEIDNKALETIRGNSEQIAIIRQQAAENGGEYTAVQLKMIQDLSKGSAEAYVSTLNVSEKEGKSILAAMTGDVASASLEQSRTWMSDLGKQRQGVQEHYAEMKKTMLQYFKDNGMENSKVAKESLKLLEDSQKDATHAMDSQIAAILEKYPELISQVGIYNGQILDKNDESMGAARSAMKEANEEIMKGWSNLTTFNGLMANDFKDKTKLVGDASTEFGKTWNSLVLDEKQANVDSNAQEKVTEASQSKEKWDELRFGAIEAKMSTTAKQMIVEAGVANGYWDELSFVNKKALLDSDVPIKVEEALTASGKWNEMSLVEKTAILRSNTPELMAQTMFELGLWDDYAPVIKELNAENYDALQKIKDSGLSLEDYNKLTPANKKLIAENDDLLQQLATGKISIDEFNQKQTDQKILKGDATNVNGAIDSAKNNLEDYNGRGVPPKEINATDNTWGPVSEANFKINDVKQNTPASVNASDNTSGPTSQANFKINEVKQYSPVGINANDLTKTPTDNAKENIRGVNDKTVTINAIDNASNVLSGVKNWIDTIKDKTVNIFTKHTENAKGTNYHPGGLAMVNDQKGPLYKELVTLPNGKSFIPEGRDVLLPLPRGSKVLPARKTKKLFPHYADGVGIPKDSEFVRNLTLVGSTASTNGDSASNMIVASKIVAMEDKLITMISILSDIAKKDSTFYFKDLNGIAKEIGKIQKRGGY